MGSIGDELNCRTLELMNRKAGPNPALRKRLQKAVPLFPITRLDG